MADYSIDVNNAIKYEILNKSDICDFWSDDLKNIVSKYYNFCRESLDKYSERIGIKPNVFIYSNDLTPNARAGVNKDRTFAIIINKGLMVDCKKTFLDNEKLNAYIEEKYKHVADNLDMKVSELAFQVATQFTFYHELAHLLQFTKNTEQIELYENVDIESEYSLEKHILEINADGFASIALATHILQYIERIYEEEEISNSNAKDIIVILGVCLLNYIANFYTDNLNLYFRENTHPHPFFRIFNIVLSFANYIHETEWRDRNINIRLPEIYQEVIDLYIELEKENIFDTKFEEFIKGGEKYQKKINDYLGEVIEFNLDNYHNAFDLWNKYIYDEIV